MRHLALIVVVLTAFQSFGALAQEPVTESAVVQYLARVYNNPGRFSVTALKQFPEGTSGTGRISLAATLTFEQPTFVSTSGLADALRATGFNDRQIAYYGAALEVRSRSRFTFDVYDVEHPAGDTVPFTGEYFYRETVSGFELTGSSTLQFGRRREDVPANAVIVGSEAFLDLLDRFRQAKAQRLTALNTEPLGTVRNDARRLLAVEYGIGHIISTEADTLVIELTDPSQTARATAALESLQTDILDSGGTLHLTFGQTGDGKITIRVGGN